MGRQSEEESRHAAAIAHYRRSLELFPTAEAWSALGRLYAREGKREDALAAYQESAALMPAAPETWLECAWLELSLADDAPDSGPHLERAASNLRRVLELDPRRSNAARQLERIERRLAAAGAELR
jgi:tetratricopeptide (TPR) repeat protein